MYGHRPVSKHQWTFRRGQSARGVVDRSGTGSRLVFPAGYPRFTAEEIAAFAEMPYHEIAFRVLWPMHEGAIPPQALADMCREAYDFDVPLEIGHDRVHVDATGSRTDGVLQGFRGPHDGADDRTLCAGDGQTLTILTATSGDTGSAVATRFTTCPASGSLCFSRSRKSATASAS